MSSQKVDVLVLGGKATAAQRKMFVQSVLPRFTEWCSRLGLGVRTAHAESAVMKGFLEVRLPARPRSKRVPLGDQIYADLCAEVAARHPDRLMAAMAYRMRPPDPITEPAIACAPPPPPPTSTTRRRSAGARSSGGCILRPPPPPADADRGCGLTASVPSPKVDPPWKAARSSGKAHAVPEPGLTALTFEVRTGGNVETVRVAARKMTLGRMPSCDVPVRDVSVSRMHARIEVRDNGGVVVEDLGSANGVYVNGRKTEACALDSGDTIRLGSAEIRVTFPRRKR